MLRYTAYHSINQTIESPYYKCNVISPDTTSIISVDCYFWGLLTAFHQTSRQLVTSRSQSRLGLTTSWSHLGHSSQRLGLVHLHLWSRLGFGRKGLVHIPGANKDQHLRNVTDHTTQSVTVLKYIKCSKSTTIGLTTSSTLLSKYPAAHERCERHLCWVENNTV